MCFVVIIVMLMVLMMEMVHFVENSKFWTDFGAGDDFLDPSRVEAIDKGLIFRLGSVPNR